MPVRYVRTAVLAAVVLLVLLLVGCGGASSTTSKTASPAGSDAALAALEEGNARFVAGNTSRKDISAAKRESLSAGQKPFAVVLGCSDSRVPPEMVFDQGLGDIFVVRVAGNVVDPVVLGSVEYAVDHLHAPLVVVLGHQGCGAVAAAIEGGGQPGDIGSFLSLIQPSVQQARSRGLTGDAEAEAVTELNVRSSMDAVNSSPIVSELVKGGKLAVKGAEYQLKSGVVVWFPAGQGD